LLKEVWVASLATKLITIRSWYKSGAVAPLYAYAEGVDIIYHVTSTGVEQKQDYMQANWTHLDVTQIHHPYIIRYNGTTGTIQLDELSMDKVTTVL
jgi:hypothetical protein